MAKVPVQFVLELSHSDEFTAARLGVDQSGDGQISPAEEVTLGTGDGKSWRGMARLQKVKGALFSLRFIAPRGTKWQLEARTDAGDSLYKNSGTLDLYSEEWLTGRLS